MAMRSVAILAIYGFLLNIAAVVAAPYQELAPRPGYVPVYIRVGDTPLSEIHPSLAKAFHEFESASLKLEDSSSTNEQKTEAPLVAASTPANAPQSAEDNAPLIEESDKTSETPVIPAENAQSSTESDIASFDVIKALNEAAVNKTN